MSRARGSYKNDPLNTFDFLMNESEKRNLVSEFYFMTGDGSSSFDGTYSIDQPHVRKLIARIHSRGHIIGYHASYNTMRDQDALKREVQHFFAVMEDLGIEQSAWGGRQHYLRFSNPSTWRNWAEAGLDYDSTLSFADHVGFRSGTCHEYPVYDLKSRRQLSLRERPLIVMEGTCLGEQYMDIGFDGLLDQCQELASRCRAVAGTFLFLWHNSSLILERARSTYQTLLNRISEEATESG